MANKTINVASVKDKYRAGATPNEDDYQNLIDLAAVGSQALGATPQDATTLHPGNGLELVDNKLTVKEGAGVTVDKNGVAVKVDGTTVKVDTTLDALAVALKDGDSGLDTTGGLHVKTAQGLTTGKNGLELALASPSGLSTAGDKLSVAIVPTASGLEFDKTTGALEVKIGPADGNFIQKSDAGLAITADGIVKIKDALKSISIKALEDADNNTSHGFQRDTVAKDPKSVEAQIAAALNRAYGEGWNLQQAVQKLAKLLNDFRQGRPGNFIKDSVISLSGLNNYLDLYTSGASPYETRQLRMARVGADGEATWLPTVKDKSISKIDSGIYAVLGLLDKDGNPQDGGDHYTQHALMIVVGEAHDDADKVRAVVGKWDFLDKWDTGRAVGAWSWCPTIDPIPKFNVRIGLLEQSGVDIDMPKWDFLRDAKKIGAELNDALTQTIESTGAIVKRHIEKDAYAATHYEGRPWKEQLGKFAYDWYDTSAKRVKYAIKQQTDYDGFDCGSTKNEGDVENRIRDAVSAALAIVEKDGAYRQEQKDWSNTKIALQKSLKKAFGDGFDDRERKEAQPSGPDSVKIPAGTAEDLVEKYGIKPTKGGRLIFVQGSTSDDDWKKYVNELDPKGKISLKKDRLGKFELVVFEVPSNDEMIGGVIPAGRRVAVEVSAIDEGVKGCEKNLTWSKDGFDVVSAGFIQGYGGASSGITVTKGSVSPGADEVKISGTRVTGARVGQTIELKIKCPAHGIYQESNVNSVANIKSNLINVTVKPAGKGVVDDALKATITEAADGNIDVYITVGQQPKASLSCYSDDTGSNWDCNTSVYHDGKRHFSFGFSFAAYVLEFEKDMVKKVATTQSSDLTMENGWIVEVVRSDKSPAATFSPARCQGYTRLIANDPNVPQSDVVHGSIALRYVSAEGQDQDEDGRGFSIKRFEYCGTGTPHIPLSDGDVKLIELNNGKFVRFYLTC
ncbi:hypothetical protein FPJ27_15390 [Burkholderia sp. MS455]|uniref:hypothetical protein n=1 Tax=Burkholderia sp. MS455 TaxID=2811788 RepID=UPI00195C9AE0|nr:hypothetical protein [Burkholderia sp. MS455]QRR07648.1 hypothetical protein FPJ27_15390 [Burkholderia sp. MS455]